MKNYLMAVQREYRGIRTGAIIVLCRALLVITVALICIVLALAATVKVYSTSLDRQMYLKEEAIIESQIWQQEANRYKTLYEDSQVEDMRAACAIEYAPEK